MYTAELLKLPGALGAFPRGFFRGKQYTNALSRLARAVSAGFKVGASVRLLACLDPVEMGVELRAEHSRTTEALHRMQAISKRSS